MYTLKKLKLVGNYDFSFSWKRQTSYHMQWMHKTQKCSVFQFYFSNFNCCGEKTSLLIFPPTCEIFGSVFQYLFLKKFDPLFTHSYYTNTWYINICITNKTFDTRSVEDVKYYNRCVNYYKCELPKSRLLLNYRNKLNARKDTKYKKRCGIRIPDALPPPEMPPAIKKFTCFYLP